MNCRSCRDHFADLLYAQRRESVTAELTATLEEHLRLCTNCAQELGALRETQACLDGCDIGQINRASAATSVPVELYVRLARAHRRLNVWRWTASAAAAVAIVLLAIGIASLTADRLASRQPPTSGQEQVPSPAGVSPAEFASAVKRLADRLEDQERLLALVTTEIKAVGGRHAEQLVALEKQLNRLDKTAEFHGLRVSAVQHDIDRMREFITSKDNVALRGAD
jgi:hypothetical protein